MFSLPRPSWTRRSNLMPRQVRHPSLVNQVGRHHRSHNYQQQDSAKNTGTHDTDIPPRNYQPPKPDQPPVQEEPSPPAPAPSLKEEAGLVAALKSYELQEWLRVLCRMHVLTQQMLLGGLEYDELLPLWAKRMKVILTPPPLFESIKLARTERALWQDVGLSAAVRHSAGPHSLHAHRYFHQGGLRPHGSQDGTAGQTCRCARRQTCPCQAQLRRLADVPTAASGARDGNEASTNSAS